MLAISAFAVPEMPYIIYGSVDWNDQLLTGARIDLTHKGTTVQLTTNEQGNYVYSLTGYSRGDTVTIRVTDGCGTGDTCSKSITIGGVGIEDYARVDFDITGTLSCPPVKCPSCNCGGGGDSYVDLATKERCAENFPCKEIVCPKPTVDECKEAEVCPECPLVEECAEQEECPDCDNGWLYEIMFGIAGLVLGSFGWWTGFKGLVNYRVKKAREAELAGDKKEADKQYKSAAKMVQTAVERAKSGEYD